MIERMLAKHPEDRYRDADELIAALGGREITVGTGEHRRWSPTPSPMPVSRPDGQDGADAERRCIRRSSTRIRRRRSTRPSTRAFRCSSGTGRGYVACSRISAMRCVAFGPRSAQCVERCRRLQPATGAVGRVFGRYWRRVSGVGKRILMSRGSTVSIASAFIIAVAVLTFSAFRMTARGGGATHNQSRCPSGVAMDGKRPFGILVDSIGSTPRGQDVAVRYDVCGLADGAAFKVQMSLVREGTKHAADRMTANFDDLAIGTGTRRQHSLAVAPLPAGNYRLTVVVTDDKGRRRDRDLPLRIVSQ